MKKEREYPKWKGEKLTRQVALCPAPVGMLIVEGWWNIDDQKVEFEFYQPLAMEVSIQDHYVRQVYNSEQEHSGLRHRGERALNKDGWTLDDHQVERCLLYIDGEGIMTDTNDPYLTDNSRLRIYSHRTLFDEKEQENFRLEIIRCCREGEVRSVDSTQGTDGQVV